MKYKRASIQPIIKLLELFSTFLFFLMMLTIGTEVVSRYVFQRPLIWTSELAVYLNIWIVFIGISFVTYSEAHIRLDFFVNKLGIKTQRVIEVVSYIIIAVISISLVFGCAFLIKRFWTLRSPTMRLPTPILYASLLIGLFLNLIVSLLKIIERIQLVIRGER